MTRSFVIFYYYTTLAQVYKRVRDMTILVIMHTKIKHHVYHIRKLIKLVIPSHRHSSILMQTYRNVHNIIRALYRQQYLNQVVFKYLFIDIL